MDYETRLTKVEARLIKVNEISGVRSFQDSRIPYSKQQLLTAFIFDPVLGLYNSAQTQRLRLPVIQFESLRDEFNKLKQSLTL